MFNLLTIVEKTIIKFVNEGIIFLRDAFEAILRELVFDNLPQVGCHKHGNEFMTEIIFKFMILCFKCIAKRKSMEKTEKIAMHTHTQNCQKQNVSCLSFNDFNKMTKPVSYFFFKSRF